MADQAAVWLLVDAVPEFVSLAGSSWEFLVANSLALSHFALIVGVYLLWRRARAADRQAAAANEQAKAANEQAKASNEQARVANVQARTAEQGHITDRFTKAIEQFGSEKMAVRLGAIYALERISKDSQEDDWTIMEVLSGYSRDNAPWSPRQEQLGRPLKTDIQASLTVLGRRHEEARARHEAAERYIDLRRTDLRGANLREAHMEGAKLQRANLKAAFLKNAHLERAGLQRAHLEGAILWAAHLEGAELWEAHLEGARLQGAHLQGAVLLNAHLQCSRLQGAHLDGADLSFARLEGAKLAGAHLEDVILLNACLTSAELYGADLRRARKLTQPQLDSALGDQDTALPEDQDLSRPAHWYEEA